MTAHKVWKILTTLLLLALSIQFTLRGFFKPKLNIDTKAVGNSHYQKPVQRKVILLLADALREDFVEFDTNMHRFLDENRPGAYKGKRLDIFRKTKQSYPSNTLFFPF